MKSLNAHSFFIIFLFAFLGIMSGCTPAEPAQENHISSETDKAAGSNIFSEERATNPTSVSEAMTPEDVLISEKLTPYVNCINENSEWVFKSYHRYTGWADPTGEISGQEENISHGLFELLDWRVQECLSGVVGTTAKASIPALEKSGQNFAEALNLLNGKINEAYEYYEERNYRDDNAAKGKVMHRPLLAAFEQYFSADENLRKEIDRVQEGIDMARLARLEKEYGRNAIYLSEYFMFLAKKFYNLTNTSTVSEINPQELSQIEEELTSTAKEISTWYEQDGNFNAPLQFYLNVAESFKIAAKELRRDIASGKEFEGAVAEELLYDYNHLVEGFNELEFPE